jgi:protein-tyrosine phosphatase
LKERRIVLEGAFNLRDLGGYPTADGRRVRHGCVYRSDNLAALTDADLDTIGDLGIRHICEFCNDLEIETQPSRIPDHPELTVERLPIGEASGDLNRLMIDQVLAGELREFGTDEMVEMYGGMLDDHPHRFARIIEHAADPARHALLFHCTAGKDRTGVAAALLLGALGVADADIVDDYVLTTEYRSGPRLQQLRPQLEEAGVDVEPLLPFFTAQGPVMELTLAGLRERHGSVEEYLTGVAGVSSSTLSSLRDVLLER